MNSVWKKAPVLRSRAAKPESSPGPVVTPQSRSLPTEDILWGLPYQETQSRTRLCKETRTRLHKSEHPNRRLRGPWNSSSVRLWWMVRAVEAQACHPRPEQTLDWRVPLWLLTFIQVVLWSSLPDAGQDLPPCHLPFGWSVRTAI